MGTAGRLAAYACTLCLVLGVGWGAGRLVGPGIGVAALPAGGHGGSAGWAADDGHGPGGHGPDDHGPGGLRRAGAGAGGGADLGAGVGGPGGGDPAGTHGGVGGDGGAGLASAAAGYRLAVATPLFQPGTAGELRFTVLGPDGGVVTGFDRTPRDPRPLHVVVVRRDAAGFQRLDPTMDADGVWRAPLTLPAPGVWRAYVDMTPAAGPTLVLGADLFAPGPFTPIAFPPSRVAQIGGFQVRLDGDLVAGEPSQVFATVTRDGAAVTDLQPYLGAFGKLVVLRQGDLAYAVAAPGDGAAAPQAPAERAGPALAFTTDVPIAGGYRLYLQFRVADVMHTAEFTIATRSP